tara:strand:+ start:1093 stop:1437 length:345 start_codon:yes stop_codon:yes gene_type:complete
MTHTIISEVNDSDRNIVMFVVDGALVGINYWYGVGDPISSLVTDYIKTDATLFKHVQKYYNNAEHDVDLFFPSPCFDEQVQRLDNIIGAIHEVAYIEEQIKELQDKINNLMSNL